MKLIHSENGSNPFYWSIKQKRKGNELVKRSLVFIDNNLLPGSILTGLSICRGFLGNSIDNYGASELDLNKIKDD